MKLTANGAMQIAEEYKKRYPSLYDTIKTAQFNSSFNVTGKEAWIVISEFEQFGEVHDFFYVISDETGQVEYTFNEHGTRNPHLPEKPMKSNKYHRQEKK